MAQRYTDLPCAARRQIIADLHAAGSAIAKGHVGPGFIAAIGDKAFAATAVAMSKRGFVCAELVDVSGTLFCRFHPEGA